MAPDDLTTEQWEAIETALYAGRKIEAIKLFREAVDCGLAEAKKTLDQHEAALRRDYPDRFTSAASGCAVKSAILVASIIPVVVVLAIGLL